MVSTQNSFSNTPITLTITETDDAEANLKLLLGSFTNGQREENSMDRGAPEYSQSGLQSPYQSTFNDSQSEGNSADHASAAQYSSQTEIPSNTYSTSATPTSEYGVYPPSARSTTGFPEHLRGRYHPASNHSGSSGDPSIAASSPTYPHGQYSPYPPQQDMTHGYTHAESQLYPQQRPNWAGYAGQQHPGIPAAYQAAQVSTPTSSASLQHRPGGQVYSFVPIPGAQQHKRPRRRYEEIERMYKCGWNGCEKAYGTLNHLNAHVTMQSHGQKRTPEEFKEIRKEWKARKKEEENQRKTEDDRSRSGQNGGATSSSDTDPSAAGYAAGRSQVQLPPIGYQPGAQVPGQYQAAAGGVGQLPGYGHQLGNDASYSGYPASPYNSLPQQKYNQPNGNGNGGKYER